MKKYILIAIALIATQIQAQDLNTFFSKSDAFFKANVKNGRVAYAQIHKNQNDLDAVLRYS